MTCVDFLLLEGQGWKEFLGVFGEIRGSGPVWDVESGGTVCVLVTDCQWPQSRACLKPETTRVTFEEFSPTHNLSLGSVRLQNWRNYCAARMSRVLMLLISRRAAVLANNTAILDASERGDSLHGSISRKAKSRCHRAAAPVTAEAARQAPAQRPLAPLSVQERVLSAWDSPIQRLRTAIGPRRRRLLRSGICRSCR
jgi:hypothetical protein